MAYDPEKGAKRTPVNYKQFIDELGPLLTEARGLSRLPTLHEDLRFRKWRHQVQDLLRQIKEQGYSVNCSVAHRAFDERGSYTFTPSDQDRLRAYERDLGDTINELQTIIGNYEKFAEPKKPMRHEKGGPAPYEENRPKTPWRHPSIIVALITVIGGGLSAVIYNWDKIFGRGGSISYTYSGVVTSSEVLVEGVRVGVLGHPEITPQITDSQGNFRLLPPCRGEPIQADVQFTHREYRTLTLLRVLCTQQDVAEPVSLEPGSERKTPPLSPRQPENVCPQYEGARARTRIYHGAPFAQQGTARIAFMNTTSHEQEVTLYHPDDPTVAAFSRQTVSPGGNAFLGESYYGGDWGIQADDSCIRYAAEVSSWVYFEGRYIFQTSSERIR